MFFIPRQSDIYIFDVEFITFDYLRVSRNHYIICILAYDNVDCCASIFKRAVEKNIVLNKKYMSFQTENYDM